LVVFCPNWWPVPLIRLAFTIIVVIILISSSILSNGFQNNKNRFAAYAVYTRALPTAGGPTVDDPNLKVEVVAKGLHIPTTMAFLGPNDILVLEKNTGNVLRVLNGEILKTPLLHVSVATLHTSPTSLAPSHIYTPLEWGLLGIAVATGRNNTNEPRNAFLYYTESGQFGQNTGFAAANRLYKYELTNDNRQLINPKLLLDLPATSPVPLGENNHNGGKVIIGPDNNVYTVIGDVGGHQGQAQNVKNGAPLDGTSGILRITQDGQPVTDNPLIGGSSIKHGKRGVIEGTSSSPSPLLSYYYAYGIRNSFGMDFDPVTGTLWDTENGPAYGDEINLVEPGFNSGWNKIQGVWLVHGPAPGPLAPENPGSDLLVDFNGKGKYRAPEFVWKDTDAPTALKFLNSDKLGQQYENTIFVGDVNHGYLYNFKLSADRTGLALTGPLAGKVAATNSSTELASVIFGKGFGVTTDLQVGPDGYLYVLTFAGTIYRIVPLHPISGNVNNNRVESTSNRPSTSFTMSTNNIPLPSNQLLTPNRGQPQQNLNNESTNSNASGGIGRLIPEHIPSRIIK
jgi:aldose sugar dehydrogenase